MFARISKKAMIKLIYSIYKSNAFTFFPIKHFYTMA